MPEPAGEGRFRRRPLEALGIQSVIFQYAVLPGGAAPDRVSRICLAVHGWSFFHIVDAERLQVIDVRGR
jgi:hypothetical protein